MKKFDNSLHLAKQDCHLIIWEGKARSVGKRKKVTLAVSSVIWTCQEIVRGIFNCTTSAQGTLNDIFTV